MAAMQFCGLWRWRSLQTSLNLRLLPHLSSIRIGSVYASPTCKFSKSSGPVRYIPQGSRSQGGRKALETQTQNTDNGTVGHERGEMDRSQQYRSSESMQQVWEKRVKDVADFDRLFSRSDDEFGKDKEESPEWKREKRVNDVADFELCSRSAEMPDDKFVKNKEESPEWNRCVPNTEQLYRKDQANSVLAPLRLSQPTSVAAIQRFVLKAQNATKAQKTAPVKKMESEKLIADLSSVKTVHHVPNETSMAPKLAVTFLTDVDGPILDEKEIESVYEESSAAGASFELEDEFHDIANYSFGSRLASSSQSTRSKQVEAASTAAQEDAKNQAIRYLAMRPYTAFQLRKKLLGRNISPELVDYAIGVVQNCGMQCDIAYAETYARSRWSSNSWGPQRIKQGLKERGVSEEVSRIALCRVFQEDEDDSDPLESNLLGMSKAAMDQLFLQASKQFLRGRNISDDTRVRRIMGWLQYRGYNHRVIAAVLRYLLKKSSDTET